MRLRRLHQSVSAATACRYARCVGAPIERDLRKRFETADAPSLSLRACPRCARGTRRDPGDVRVPPGGVCRPSARATSGAARSPAGHEVAFAAARLEESSLPPLQVRAHIHGAHGRSRLADELSQRPAERGRVWVREGGSPLADPLAPLQKLDSSPQLLMIVITRALAAQRIQTWQSPSELRGLAIARTESAHM